MYITQRHLKNWYQLHEYIIHSSEANIRECLRNIVRPTSASVRSMETLKTTPEALKQYYRTQKHTAFSVRSMETLKSTPEALKQYYMTQKHTALCSVKRVTPKRKTGRPSVLCSATSNVIVDSFASQGLKKKISFQELFIQRQFQ